MIRAPSSCISVHTSGPSHPTKCVHLLPIPSLSIYQGLIGLLDLTSWNEVRPELDALGSSPVELMGGLEME